MLKWFAISLLCVLLINGCATQNPEPASEPVSNAPVTISNPNPEPISNTSVGNSNSSPNNFLKNLAERKPRFTREITRFPDYDSTFVSRVTSKWFDLLDSGKFNLRDGRVVLQFALHSDGNVSDMKIAQNNVSEVLANVCVDAVQKCAPFQQWSPEMVKKLGTYVDVQFTFDYF